MAKKSFSASIPAEMFFSAPVAADEEKEEVKKAPEKEPAPQPVVQEIKKDAAQPAPKAPRGYKLNPMYIETKSRRLQLLIKPSTYDKIRAKAEDSGISVNEMINQILEQA